MDLQTLTNLNAPSMPKEKPSFLSRGLLAGFIGGILGGILFYLAGVIATGIYSREFFPTLLAAVTYIPLMLLFFSFPLMLLGLLIGFSLGLVGKSLERIPNLWIALFLGMGGAALVLKFLVPLVFTPKPGDFTSIVSNVYFAAGYGSILGMISQRLFLRFCPASSPKKS